MLALPSVWTVIKSVVGFLEGSSRKSRLITMCMLYRESLSYDLGHTQHLNTTPHFCLRHINTSCMSFNSGFELLTPSLYVEKLKCPKMVFANKNDREGEWYSSNIIFIISYINIVKRCCKLPISSPGKTSSDLNRRLIIFKSNIKSSLQN